MYHLELSESNYKCEHNFELILLQAQMPSLNAWKYETTKKS